MRFEVVYCRWGFEVEDMEICEEMGCVFGVLGVHSKFVASGGFLRDGIYDIMVRFSINREILRLGVG